MNLSEKKLDDLIKLNSFANTPSFIFSKFRSNPYIQSLSKTHRSEELLAELSELLKNEKLNLEVTTKAYAVLMALSLKSDWIQQKKYLEKLPLSKLRWSSYLMQMIDAKNINTTKAIFNYTTPLSASTVSKSISNNKVIKLG